MMPTTPLPDPRSSPDKDADLVRRMFDRVAPRYDVANSIFSLGQDRHWRRVAVTAVHPGPGQTILDVAAGTGALAEAAARHGARVIAADFSWNMLATGAARGHAGVWWCNADARRLPLADASVDSVLIGFGLRNLPDPSTGLREFARVVRPGGQLAVLEFSRPLWGPFRAVYTRYLVGAMPVAARLFTSDPASYRYLADSIRAWPEQEALGRMIERAGWEQVRWKNLSGGIVALHHARRPQRPTAL